MSVTLKYIDYTYINPGLGSVGYAVFRANSLYDPDFTGVGHQPLGFDQLAVLYNHYVVNSARIKVQVHSAAGATHPTAFGILLNDDNTPPGSNWTTLAESHNGVYKVIGQGTTTGTLPSLTLDYSCRKFFGVKDPTDSAQVSAVTTNPTDGAYFIVWLADTPQGTVDLPAVDLVVEIDYNCVFTEQQPVDRS